MKYILLLFLFLSICIFSNAQPDNIKRIMEKMKAGQDPTEAEEEAMDKWMDSMDKSNNSAKKTSGTAAKGTGTAVSTSSCPKALQVKPKITPLTTETYVALAKSLMAAYGPKMGISIADMNKQLDASEKPTDGADLGAMFMMVGAGSATIYSTSWSAVKKPGDVLTANTLGVALKDMGEYVKALQVLLYANNLKPNIPLISINLGWVYREMGDAVNAKLMFSQALKLAPDLPSAQLGLGLIAQCEGNYAMATQYLRKALASRNSVAGIKAYKQAQAAQPGSQSDNQDQSVSKEKGEAGELEIPELPVTEQKGQMAQAGQTLTDYSNRLSSRLKGLIEEYQSLSRIVGQQAAKAKQNPDGSIVFSRDFSKELFMLQDISELLWGRNSNWARKVDESTKLYRKISENAEKDMPAANQMMEQSMRLIQEQTHLTEVYMEDLKACGGNSDCQKQAEAKLEAALAPVKAEMEQLEFRSCKMQKGSMDVMFANKYKAWKILSDELRTTARDYYAFTNPILEKIYAPSFNELLNVFREIMILNWQDHITKMALGMPEEAQQYAQLKCVEPEPPTPPTPAEDPKLPKKDKAPCPLGENGISKGIGAFAFELSCDHFKLSGGEGLLWSVKRDFNKHETTVWGGVGVKGDYGKGNVSVEAVVGVELTVGQNDVLKDAALTSSVKAGLAGLVEGEISGRYAVEGGPSLEATGGMTTPELPGMPGADN
jgi:tetratricopeptide (TPR) repeat protein